jgi:hypothetical protein
MSRDLDLSAGGVIDGTESIDEVGARVFEHVRKVASGEVLARAEEQATASFSSGPSRRSRFRVSTNPAIAGFVDLLHCYSSVNPTLIVNCQ